MTDGRQPNGIGARPSFGTARLAEDTRERFLREIVARLPSERLDECFLFPPIRQGGAESGVAVLAVRQPVEVTTAAEDASLVDVTPDGDPTEAAAGGDVPDVASVSDGSALDATPHEAAAHADAAHATALEDDVAVEEPARDEASHDAVAREEPAPAVAPPSSTAAAATPARERHVVYVARYRLLVKGPERGRWEVEVREEADAPLITVEEVVRGVGRRAGDASEPTRLDGAAVARLLAPAGAALAR